jgi:hypothetical protein
MILNLISLATVKTQLGITASTYDAALTALIPIVSSDIRRILNNWFDDYVSATFTAGSTNITLELTYRDFKYPMGQVIYNSNLPDDTYLTGYDYKTGIYTLSTTPTGAGDHVYPTILISQWSTISKMIWYKYSKQNISSANERGVTSESFGPVSVNYSESEINKQYNYPQVLINDLGAQYARVG